MATLPMATRPTGVYRSIFGQPVGRHGYMVATNVVRFYVATSYGRLHCAAWSASLYMHLSARDVTACTGWLRALDRLRSEEHTSELQSPDHIVCRLLL